MKKITQIIGNTVQGMTEPMLCRAEGGEAYYVKHAYALAGSLIREWMAGRIAQQMQLPIPEFDLLYCEPGLARQSAVHNADQLTRMPCFGSREAPDVVQFSAENCYVIPSELRATILLFDWWVLNGDRSDGNSNLLWSIAAKRLWIIDHNLAFDETETASAFWDAHVFRRDREVWDSQFQRKMTGIMVCVLDRIESYWNEMPEEWTDAAPVVTLAGVRRILERAIDAPDPFWNAK